MRAGEKNPSKSRKLQGQVRSYNSKVMEEINHHGTKAAPAHLPCQCVHTTSDMGKEGGQDNTVGKAIIMQLFCPRIENTLCPGNLGMFIHAGDSIKSFEADGIATDPHDITRSRLKQSRKSSPGHRSGSWLRNLRQWNTQSPISQSFGLFGLSFEVV